MVLMPLVDRSQLKKPRAHRCSGSVFIAFNENRVVWPESVAISLLFDLAFFLNHCFT